MKKLLESYYVYNNDVKPVYDACVRGSVAEHHDEVAEQLVCEFHEPDFTTNKLTVIIKI